jgi:hypothetical protein
MATINYVITPYPEPARPIGYLVSLAPNDRRPIPRHGQKWPHLLK